MTPNPCGGDVRNAAPSRPVRMRVRQSASPEEPARVTAPSDKDRRMRLGRGRDGRAASGHQCCEKPTKYGSTKPCKPRRFDRKPGRSAANESKPRSTALRIPRVQRSNVVRGPIPVRLCHQPYRFPSTGFQNHSAQCHLPRSVRSHTTLAMRTGCLGAETPATVRTAIAEGDES